MQAIPNKVVIGDEKNPILSFFNDTIESVTEESAVSPIGDELFIDQFVPVVKYGLVIRYVICPADRVNYDRILTKEGFVLCANYNYDIRAIPYGTPIRFYTDGRIAGLYYCDGVERIGKEKFKINCISAIGLMDKQRHKGGVYVGERFEDVAREIMGEEYDFQIDPDVADVQVYGWLPYSTRRKNLHQLLVAFGVNIIKSDIGGMLFTFLKTIDAEEIPNNRVFSGGNVAYGEPASRVEVLEHGFHYMPEVDYEVLYDTQSDIVENTIVTFDHPVYADSLTVEEGGNLVISSCGTNYAVVSGAGKLKGKPYIHTTKLISADNEDAITEKIVTVEEATLVTMANAENVLARLSSYYFNVAKVTNSIKVDNERAGKRYIIENPYYEHTNAFLAKMSSSVSSFVKAQCEFIADFVPIAQGSSFLKRDLLRLSDKTQSWKVPKSVFEKDTPQIRVVLIGEGYDGESGEDGEKGETGRRDDGGAGGKGGKGGTGGAGGRILSVRIDCSNVEYLSYGRTGKNTWIKAGGKTYNSVNGISSQTGYVDMFTGSVYGLPGESGADGADGGKGGSYPPLAGIGGNDTEATDGGNIDFEGVTYKGGKGADRTLDNNSQYGGSENLNVMFGGCGGGGAAPGNDGEDGAAGRWWTDAYMVAIEYAKGGKGGDAQLARPTISMFGQGGNGGSGGGGGGGGENAHWWNYAYTTLIYISGSEGGEGGKGSPGTPGYEGCILIYY